MTGRRLTLDPEPLSLGRRATYRRVLAVIKSTGHPFVVGGAIGLSLWLGRLVDGELELYTRPEDIDATLDSVAATGLRIERDGTHYRARIQYGDHRVGIRWGLPTPLSGDIDESWFQRAQRTHFLGLRVKVAPAEELIWLRMSVPSSASVGDPLIAQLLLTRGASLDWNHLLGRMAGLEALLLSHLFLFWHQYPESARAILPDWVVPTLLDRMNGLAERSFVPSLQ